MDNYIVTFEQREMVTAFAILAMFLSKQAAALVREIEKLKGILQADDDEGVEKDQGLPGMFSVHLVEKIWILVNFI